MAPARTFVHFLVLGVSAENAAMDRKIVLLMANSER